MEAESSGFLLCYWIFQELWKLMLSLWELQAVLKTCIAGSYKQLRIKICIKTFKNYGYVYDLYYDVCRIMAVSEFMSLGSYRVKKPLQNTVNDYMGNYLALKYVTIQGVMVMSIFLPLSGH
ncbi:hypothetical protein I3842_09G125600 [Carya illinoinensis]|uniref:Uncharacterized protein n=1 Tax=Carya illinoinensis TaxID=32201 RepID=A0A922J789_CARIL|nr:hypothetical protein I3842_09G125600 [Carya illinoinensis]KAG6696007.1 hypothetical protein I3842_09G125600 [Carya illinoinensis]KAG6696008.1 hypothetical protein I3842_09G125600 [Carya illinoinensis]